MSRRPRRVRGLRETLLSIVLGLEAFLLFFLTLVVFGLEILDPLPAFAGGGAFFLALLALAGLQRHPAAVWIGAVVQLALIAAGLLLPIMFALGAAFAGMWLWAYLRARQIERARAEHLANHPAPPDGAVPSDAEGEPS